MDRQKVLIIFGAAWVSAALLTWIFISKVHGSKAQATRRVVVASHDLPLGTRIRKPDIKMVEALDRDLPKGGIFSDKDAIDRALLIPVSANEPLTNGKLTSTTGADGIAAIIEAGMRAVSVPINDSSGVAGLIQPNSRVDVMFTRPGSMAEAVTSVILQNIKVLAVGRITAVGQALDAKAPKMPVATLLMTPEDAQKLELAKNEGKVSLTLRNPLDQASVPDLQPVNSDALDPVISARLARARRGRTTNIRGKIPNLDDPRVWQELTGEKKLKDEEAPKKIEPQKPRLVVDVFRGDKHVQEIFR
jgi:pilus assembly protein CpaB